MSDTKTKYVLEYVYPGTNHLQFWNQFDNLEDAEKESDKILFPHNIVEVKTISTILKTVKKEKNV